MTNTWREWESPPIGFGFSQIPIFGTITIGLRGKGGTTGRLLQGFGLLGNFSRKRGDGGVWKALIFKGFLMVR